MATYEYMARNGAGEEVAGVIQGDSEAAVIRTLDERRLFPVRVKAQEVRRRRIGRGRIRSRSVAAVYEGLSDLMRAGVPLLQSIETIARTMSNQRLVAVLTATRDDVADGKHFADALAAHPKVFPALHTAMVRAGEQGGFLEDVLKNLGDFMERQEELRGKIQGAMVYPIFLAIIGGSITMGFLLFFVPQFKPMFAGMTLPVPTVVLFALSDIVRDYWPVVLGVLATVGLAFWGMVRSAPGRRMLDEWRMKMPVVGRVLRLVSITRFCRILGTMLANGVPILQSLAIAKDATGSALLAEAIDKAAETVRAGERLATPLKACGLFPLEVVEMISVAEESNQLEKILVEIADTVERRTNRQVDLAVRLIEPLILVMMAGGIAFVAVGLYYPILTMASTLK